MILANSLSALFLKEKEIPAIYRGQMEPREKIPPMDKFDALQAYRLRRIMNRVEISTRPQRHAGLGAEAYLTLTSPIRRFYDLLAEHQILGALRGTPVWTQEQLEEIITRVGPTLSKVGLSGRTHGAVLDHAVTWRRRSALRRRRSSWTGFPIGT